jgi:hypothetical protein
MPRISATAIYRKLARDLQDHLDDDRLSGDHRAISEHRKAHQRILASGGDICPYCADY